MIVREVGGKGEMVGSNSAARDNLSSRRGDRLVTVNDGHDVVDKRGLVVEHEAADVLLVPLGLEVVVEPLRGQAKGGLRLHPPRLRHAEVGLWVRVERAVEMDGVRARNVRRMLLGRGRLRGRVSDRVAVRNRCGVRLVRVIVVVRRGLVLVVGRHRGLGVVVAAEFQSVNFAVRCLEEDNGVVSLDQLGYFDDGGRRRGHTGTERV